MGLTLDPGSLILSQGLTLDLAHFKHVTSAQEQSLGGRQVLRYEDRTLYHTRSDLRDEP